MKNTVIILLSLSLMTNLMAMEEGNKVVIDLTEDKAPTNILQAETTEDEKEADEIFQACREECVKALDKGEFQICLVGKGLKAFPNRMFNDYSLQVTILNLKSTLDYGICTPNGISVIPPEIECCVNLTYLDLEYNKIEVIPDEMMSLNKLTTLVLNGNPLNKKNLIKLPKSIKYLHLKRCQLTELKEELISELKNLVFIDLSDNKINTLLFEKSNSSFSPWFGALLKITSLTRIKMNENSLEDGSRNALSNWFGALLKITSLTRIKMNENSLEDGSRNALSKLKGQKTGVVISYL